VDEARMAVPLVEGGLGGEEVVVTFSIDVPDVDAWKEKGL
jgi:hypothetical protein